MEQSFKNDVLQELRSGDGRILLHDEVEERPGVFTIIPLWETVSEGDIMTPRDVMDLVAKEGYKVSSNGLQHHKSLIYFSDQLWPCCYCK